MAIFTEHKGGMSTNWNKYSSADRTRAQATNPGAVGVVAVVAENVTAVDGLEIHHRPLMFNRSHTDVVGIGEKGPQHTARRAALFQTFDNAWVIKHDEGIIPTRALAELLLKVSLVRDTDAWNRYARRNCDRNLHKKLGESFEVPGNPRPGTYRRCRLCGEAIQSERSS